VDVLDGGYVFITAKLPMEQAQHRVSFY
jgi:hypothetical protein